MSFFATLTSFLFYRIAVSCQPQIINAGSVIQMDTDRQRILAVLAKVSVAVLPEHDVCTDASSVSI